MTPAERFAANLKAARSRAGMSQQEAGHRAALHRTEIGLLETAKRMPRIDTLLKVAGAVGAEPAELLAGLQWHPKKGGKGRWEIIE
jgi:transcriptional regulator with XRE-family HTH domain